jgi:hypothetical protein
VDSNEARAREHGRRISGRGRSIVVKKKRQLLPVLTVVGSMFPILTVESSRITIHNSIHSICMVVMNVIIVSSLQEHGRFVQGSDNKQPAEKSGFSRAILPVDEGLIRILGVDVV